MPVAPGTGEAVTSNPFSIRALRTSWASERKRSSGGCTPAGRGSLSLTRSWARSKGTSGAAAAATTGSMTGAMTGAATAAATSGATVKPASRRWVSSWASALPCIRSWFQSLVAGFSTPKKFSGVRAASGRPFSRSRTSSRASATTPSAWASGTRTMTSVNWGVLRLICTPAPRGWPGSSAGIPCASAALRSFSTCSRPSRADSVLNSTVRVSIFSPSTTAEPGFQVMRSRASAACCCCSGVSCPTGGRSRFMYLAL